MRVSATNLESFRLFMDPNNDWFSEQALIDSLTGKFIPTPAVKLGHAYHSVLETPERYRVPRGYACEGFSFDDATMQPMLDLIDRRGVFEVKSTKQIGDITLVAQADQLAGARLYEFKTTGSSFDVEKYLDSMQWRVMCLVFEPLSVTYRVASLNDHGNGVVELRTLDSFTLYPYAALHQDCETLLGAFVEYVTRKGLDGYLRQRQTEAA